MCIFCDIFTYIGDNFRDIIQTVLGIIALFFAYLAWCQYRQDKQVEYWKLDYQIAKDIYDYYNTDKDIAKLIDMEHKEAEDIPATKLRLQNSMIRASHKLQKILIPFVYKCVKLSDEIDTSDKMSI